MQKIYHYPRLHKTCKDISNKYKLTLNLNAILTRSIYGRIIFLSSKLSTFELSKRFIEQPDFELQHTYRALDVLSKETDLIQLELYKNSLKVCDDNKEVLYYDCTNYFFEIDQKEDLKQYGVSKEHRPNPIVHMNFFIDGDGVPLAFS